MSKQYPDCTTKRERELYRDLRALVRATEAFIDALDVEMRKPSTVDRGRRIAALSNALELHKDTVRFNSMRIDFRTGRVVERGPA